MPVQVVSVLPVHVDLNLVLQICSLMILVNVSDKENKLDTDGDDEVSHTFLYTSTKSWRGYIFTSVCLCVCECVLINKKRKIWGIDDIRSS